MKTQTAVFMFVLAVGSAPAFAKVQGLYGTDCLKVEGLSAFKDLVFDIDEFKQVQTVYLDSECQTAAYDFTFAGPYTLTDKTGYLNYSFNSVRLTPLDSEVATNFNNHQLCGIDVWQVGKAQDVAGLECGEQKIPSVQIEVYDMIQESQAAISLSRATDDLDGSSAEKRPQEFDDLVYFAK